MVQVGLTMDNLKNYLGQFYNSSFCFIATKMHGTQTASSRVDSSAPVQFRVQLKLSIGEEIEKKTSFLARVRYHLKFKPNP
jgi:hypothetical protein